jgi:ATP-dependent RNA helicase DDX24/MAK5
VISDDRADRSKRLIKTHEAKLVQLKAELRGLLKQPLVARGVSTRYVTSGSNPIAHDMLSGECKLGGLIFPRSCAFLMTETDHEGMIGVRKTEAGHDIAPRKGRTVTKDYDEEFEEWTGIS